MDKGKYLNFLRKTFKKKTIIDGQFIQLSPST